MSEKLSALISVVGVELMGEIEMTILFCVGAAVAMRTSACVIHVCVCMSSVINMVFLNM